MASASTRLSCGCIRGRLACKEALRLLRQLAESYADGVREGRWESFNEWRWTLETHYQEHSSTVLEDE
jgi:hypothetical protein